MQILFNCKEKENHHQRRYPWGPKELDMTEQLN